MAEKDVDEQFAAIMAHWDDVALGSDSTPELMVGFRNLSSWEDDEERELMFSELAQYD